MRSVELFTEEGRDGCRFDAIRPRHAHGRLATNAIRGSAETGAWASAIDRTQVGARLRPPLTALTAPDRIIALKFAARPGPDRIKLPGRS